MKKFFTKYLFILAIMICASSLFAQNTVSLNIKDMPVRDVISNLMAQSDVNIIMTDDARMDKKIRINLTNCDIEKALNYIMQASGLSFKKVDESTYIIGGSSVEMTGDVFNPDSLLSNLSSPANVEQEVVKEKKSIPGVRVIELAYVNPTQLLKDLGWQGNSAGNSNYYNYNTHNKRIKYTDNGQMSVPSIDPSVDDGSGRTAEFTSLAGARNNNNNNNNNNNSNRNNNNNNNSNNSNSDSDSSSFGGAVSFLDPYTEDGDDGSDPLIFSLIPYELNNSIMCRGDKDAIDQFEKDIRKFDIPPRQVEIKVEFVSITTEETKSFGIDWLIGKTGRQFNTDLGVMGNVSFLFESGNLQAAVAAELTNSLGKLVNSPIVSTLNNIEGEISFTKKLPKFTSSVSGDGVNPIATYSSKDIEITTDLYVTPRINRDNSITMVIEANVGDEEGEVISPDGKSSSWITTDQEINTIRRVYDGETVVIGGLIRQQNDKNVSKIPLLGDLPLIGQLFRNESISKDETELLIFITPRIIHDSINMNKIEN